MIPTFSSELAPYLWLGRTPIQMGLGELISKTSSEQRVGIIFDESNVVIFRIKYH
jgi:hypothetical protein